MRILILSQWFDPEPMPRGMGFARELIRRGHEVEVLTGFPNYPGGKLYEGYKIGFYRREVLDGVTVHRVPLYPSHDQSSWKRILNYLSFALSASFVGAFRVGKADVMYVYHPPATVALPAVVIKLLRCIPFVYDIQDLWPDTLTATGMFNGRVGLRLVNWWCNWTYRQASMITVISPGFQQALVARGVAPSKIRVIYNWCDETLLAPRERDHALAAKLGLDGRFNVMFAGTMGKAQALDTVVDAAVVLQSKLPLVQIVFVGGGVERERLETRVTALGLQNVCFFPRIPIAEVARYLAFADVLLVHLASHPLFRITVPSKTQAYMRVGRPIAMAVEGDAAKLVEDAGAGLCCASDDSVGMVSLIERLSNLPERQLEKLGQNGAIYYEKFLSMEIGVDHFLGVFDQLCNARRSMSSTQANDGVRP